MYGTFDSVSLQPGDSRATSLTALIGGLRAHLTQQLYNPVVIYNQCRGAEYFLEYLVQRNVSVDSAVEASERVTLETRLPAVMIVLANRVLRAREDAIVIISLKWSRGTDLRWPHRLCHAEEDYHALAAAAGRQCFAVLAKAAINVLPVVHDPDITGR